MASPAPALIKWNVKDYPKGSASSRRECRFSPTCSSYSGCPDNLAEFSERVGGTNFGGHERFIALCRHRAVARHGDDVVAAIDGSNDC
jgi:putative component of membrane protein insertase Oxa1/YidC/SpoIIIJ protein YidD